MDSNNHNTHLPQVPFRGFRGIILIITLIIGISSPAFSQKQVRKDIREGNKEYRQGKFTDAEVDYRKALETDARSVEAAYNLGNTLYKQGKGQESLEQYQIVVGNEKDKTKLSMAWHNVGNIFMATKDYKRSIDAYKNALRNNPKDNETRYNLALAQKLLDDQQNQDQNQDQQKDEQKQDEQQQDQDQQNQDQQQDQKDQQDQQQNPDKMSKQNADHILDAMMQEEKNTQEKVKMEQMNRQKQKKTDKNW